MSGTEEKIFGVGGYLFSHHNIQYNFSPVLEKLTRLTRGNLGFPGVFLSSVEIPEEVAKDVIIFELLKSYQTEQASSTRNLVG